MTEPTETKNNIVNNISRMGIEYHAADIVLFFSIQYVIWTSCPVLDDS